MQITLSVNLSDVLEDIAQSTHYSGEKARVGGDASGFKRISSTKADKNLFSRYITEASSTVTEKIKPFLVSLSNTSTLYEAVLEESSSFDPLLVPSINTSLTTFFTSYVLSRWYNISNKADASTCEADAIAALNDVMRKLYYRRKPTRIPPSKLSHVVDSGINNSAVDSSSIADSNNEISTT
jgi:hypothetical protein